MTVFSPEVVAGVLHHMNDDHNADSLLFVHAFAGVEADSAVMTGFDHLGGTWSYTVGGVDHELTIPWATEISERPEVRREIVAIYDRACAKLGVEPRPHG